MDVESDEIEGKFIFFLENMKKVVKSICSGMPVWLKAGAFKNINQVAIEFHNVHLERYASKVLSILQDLYKKNFRLISFDLNTCVLNSNGPKNHFPNIEVVLKKQKWSRTSSHCL